GDVEIPAARKVAVRVQAEDGAPIPRARVLVRRDESLTLSGMSKDDGRTEIQLATRPLLLRVVGCGWMPVEKELPADATDVVFTLPRATTLHLRVVFADGATPAAAASVWLESEQRVLEPSAISEQAYFQPRAPDWEATAWGSSESGGQVRLGS